MPITPRALPVVGRISFAGLWAAVRAAGGSPVRRHVACLLVVNALVAAFAFEYYTIEFFPDSSQYVRAAMALDGDAGGQFYYYRTIGYSAFLYLLGLTRHGDFAVVLAAQVGIGVVTPVVIYAALRNVGCRYAFPAALVVSLSFCTFIHSTLIMTDQLAMGLMYVVLYLLSKSVAAGRSGVTTAVASAPAGFALIAIRPAALLLWLCAYAPAALRTRPRWRGAGEFAAALAVIGGLMYLTTSWQTTLTDAWYQNRKTTENLERFEWAGMEGKLLFWQVYGVAPHVAGSAPVSAEAGEHNHRMIWLLYSWAEKNPLGIKSYMKADTPAEFIQRLYTAPDFHKHSVMWLALDQEVGPVEANKVMRRAAVEAVRHDPTSLTVFANYFAAFFVLGDLEYNYGYAKINYDVLNPDTVEANFGWRETWIDEELPPAMVQSLHRQADGRQLDKSFDIGLFVVLYLLKLVCLGVFAVSLVRMRSRWRFLTEPLVLSGVLMLLYQAAVCSLFAAPCYRYWTPFLPLMVMLAALAHDRRKNPVALPA